MVEIDFSTYSKIVANDLSLNGSISTALGGGVVGSGGGSIVTGMILCWSGSADAVPSGWALCDGNNGTPDLTGKFVLGYGSSHSKAGTIGNNDEPKIVETTHLPPIAHADGDSNAPRVDHPSSTGVTDYTLSYSSNYDGGMIAVSDGWVGLPADHGAASVDDQEPYYPPYYVLAYIMKTGDTSSSSGVESHWTQSTNDLYYTTGNVGIGTTDPSNLLHLYSSGDSSQVRLSNGTSTAGFILEQNTDKHTYISNTESTGDIIFNAGNAVKMRLMSDNIVTIGQGGRIRMLNDGKTSFHPTGNVDPKFQLDVFGQILAYHHTYGNAGVQLSGREYMINGISDRNPFEGYTTARFQEGVIARTFFAYSDSRIKTNIQEVNDSSALDKLRLLKPSLYNYIDVLSRGNNQVYGFIAQEVKEVLPDAVSQYPEFIPNIYSFGTYDASTNIITIQNENYDSASLSMDASNNIYKNVRMYDASDNVLEVCIEEIVGTKEIKIKQDSEVNITSSIFVYGQEVDDFHKLNKDAIFTVTTSALQEVDRQQQADKIRITSLESQLTDEKAKVASLETQLADVLQRLTNAGI